MVQTLGPPLEITWNPLPEDFVLPDDPVENIQQPYLAAALTDALGAAGKITPETLIASNFGLVATVNQKTVVKAPDWLWVPRVNPVASGGVRRSYTPYLEGEAVGIGMEFLSDTETGKYSYRPIYPYGKLYFYEQILQVPTYAIFDPVAPFLEVRRLQDGHYKLQSPNSQGRYWVPELELWLGVWQGERLGLTTHWLRWWDAAGNLLLWASERSQQERDLRFAAISKLAAMGLTHKQIAQALEMSIAEVAQAIES